MVLTQVETVLNQMKRSGRNQSTVTVTAAGQIVVPYVENRVSLVVSSNPTSLLTLSLTPTVGVGLGVTIPAAAAALVLSLAQVGSVVKGPLYAADGTFPAVWTYWEAINDAP